MMYGPMARIQKDIRLMGFRLAVWTEPFEVRDVVDKEPDVGVVIGEEAAQLLMDDLWQAGVRPTESPSGAALEATERHLQDAIQLRDKLLKAALPKILVPMGRLMGIEQP